MRRRAGYTLIELIVVLAVMGIASSIGFGIYARVDELWDEAKTRAELENRALNIFDTIRRDVAQVLPPARSGVPILGEDAAADSSEFLRVPLANDSLVLPVALKDARSGYTGYAQARYHIAREGQPNLLRSLSPIGAAAPDAEGTPVGEGVFDFNLGFYDGAAWSESWNKPEAPKRLRVSLTLGDPSYPAVQIAREMTFVLPY